MIKLTSRARLLPRVAIAHFSKNQKPSKKQVQQMAKKHAITPEIVLPKQEQKSQPASP
jgi:hypothetical protein